jgi:hypothetical protein
MPRADRCVDQQRRCARVLPTRDRRGLRGDDRGELPRPWVLTNTLRDKRVASAAARDSLPSPTPATGDSQRPSTDGRNIMFSQALASAGVTANCCDPGFNTSGLARELPVAAGLDPPHRRPTDAPESSPGWPPTRLPPSTSQGGPPNPGMPRAGTRYGHPARSPGHHRHPPRRDRHRDGLVERRCITPRSGSLTCRGRP